MIGSSKTVGALALLLVAGLAFGARADVGKDRERFVAPYLQPGRPGPAPAGPVPGWRHGDSRAHLAHAGGAQPTVAARH